MGRDPGTGRQIQKSVYGKTQGEVVDKLRDVTSEISKGIFTEPSALTVGAWFDLWISEYVSNPKPKTLQLYKGDIKNYIKPALGAVKLQKLQAPAIQTLYNKLLKGDKERKPLSAKTIKNLHGVIHSSLEQAVELNYIPYNPAKKCKLPKITRYEMKPLGDMTALFINEIKGHRYELLFLLDLFTGMRRSEIIGLSWDCVDFERSSIRIYRQLQYFNGQYVFLSLKSNKPRSFTVPPLAIDALREQKRRQAEWKLKAGSAWNNQDNLVFTDELGHNLSHNSVSKHFKAIVRSIGAPDIRFHDLRHSYATAALQSGVNVKMVQEALGHHTAAFTLDTYGHVTDEMQREAAAKIEAYYKGLETCKGYTKG
ncbi:MAG: site-specific integrase [Peptococcaceae bacterium]|nr:site-specific integrase [Peptococcaceae bacterium]